MTYEHVLDVDEQKELLRIARTTVKEFMVSGRTPPGAPHKQSLLAPAGVFASFHHGEALRGCIGTTQETQALYKAVQEMAIAAATRDPRFPAVRLEELPKTTIEISVLGARRPMAAPSDIVLGTHGLQVTAGGAGRQQRGLLLPKVAVEHGWDAETFLGHACAKAGLPPDWWRGNEANVELFTAQVFDEKTLRVGPFAPT